MRRSRSRVLNRISELTQTSASLEVAPLAFIFLPSTLHLQPSHPAGHTSVLSNSPAPAIPRPLAVLPDTPSPKLRSSSDACCLPAPACSSRNPPENLHLAEQSQKSVSEPCPPIIPQDTCSSQIRNLNTIYGYKTLDAHNILGHDCYCEHFKRRRHKRPENNRQSRSNS